MCKFLLVCSFQNLLAAVSLRRTKDMETGSKRVNLPPKSVTEYYVHLSAEERGYYDQIEHEGRMKMKEFGDNDSILRNYSTMLYFVLRLRQLCNDVALCPLDRKLWLPAHPLEGMLNIISKLYLPFKLYGIVVFEISCVGWNIMYSNELLWYPYVSF